MTEAEWLACDDPTPMLEFLRAKASDRKLRLFAVGCCRRIWDRLTDDRGRLAVSISERYADGMATEQELIEAAERVHHELPSDEWAVCYAINPSWDSGYSPGGRTATNPYAYWAAIHCADEASGNVAGGVPARSVEVVVAEQGNQACLLRDIFGNPFRPVTAEPTCLTSTVLSLAEGIYADRAFDRLPILADALQDAGCEDAEILNHCRSDGPHVRGCWVVDLILGKK